ncbi:MarR family winged helix-turn-helix transcriptional regulator [Ramlibacter humi]|uniref:MarR family transcriptional regulator n=1 Tax=Ramlibacter humi TaxID=2530451 RepID=A0A4Z0BB56_9BURK|nr:MarR family winged helix-turn-helix transcriptional regulator [Ramlibacter humi]TFY96332.1 MarR family transcriptional regulator [Ramlibacter humi]
MAESLPVDSSLFFKLVRVVNLTARPFHDTVGKANHLTLNEWRAMVVLASHPGVAAADIAESTGLDKMAVSRAIAGLDKTGRLVKKEDPGDQRRSRLYLSAEGQRLFTKVGRTAKKREAELFNGISAEELERFGATADKLVAAVRGLR